MINKTPKRKPTQLDVAQLAGVSRTTVSYVLNGNETISVPLHTRQRILDAARDLRYVPDQTARSLRTQKTYTIAAIIPDITNPFYPAFARGIQDVARRHSYDLILYNTDAIAEEELKCLHSVQQGRVDGVIVVLFKTSADALIPLAERGIIVVSLVGLPGAPHEYPVDQLGINNTQAMRTGVDYLIEKGHRRIAMLVGREGPPRIDRVKGYQLALTAHGLAEHEWVVEAEDFTEHAGYETMRWLLKHSELPDAIAAANDLIAIGAIRAIHEAGLHVPDDIAVLGFDDISPAKWINPPLTTVAHFPEAAGVRATEMLFERLNGEAPPHGRSEELPFELIVRASA